MIHPSLNSPFFSTHTFCLIPFQHRSVGKQIMNSVFLHIPPSRRHRWCKPRCIPPPSPPPLSPSLPCLLLPLLPSHLSLSSLSTPLPFSSKAMLEGLCPLPFPICRWSGGQFQRGSFLEAISVVRGNALDAPSSCLLHHLEPLLQFEWKLRPHLIDFASNIFLTASCFPDSATLCFFSQLSNGSKQDFLGVLFTLIKSGRKLWNL